jgi:hypothetical protein
VHYRCLGRDGYSLRSIERSSISYPRVSLLTHNEATTSNDGTTPTIGTGDSKILRDHACNGVTVGCDNDN